MLRSNSHRLIAALGCGCLFAGITAFAEDWTQVPRRDGRSTAQTGPELRPQAGRTFEREIPVPPPQSAGEENRSVLPPPPAPDRRYEDRRNYEVAPRPAPQLESRPLPAPVYRQESYAPSRRFGLHIPGLLNIEVSRSRDRAPRYGVVDQTGQPQPVSYSQIYGQTEQLAKRLRDIHVYLHRRGDIENFQPLMNTSRENLEAMKELARKGYPLERLQAQLDSFDHSYHPLERQLYDAAAWDASLRPLVDLVARLEDDMHRALNMARPY
jgi:hypothetical protein